MIDIGAHTKHVRSHPLHPHTPPQLVCIRVTNNCNTTARMIHLTTFDRHLIKPMANQYGNIGINSGPDEHFQTHKLDHNLTPKTRPIDGASPNDVQIDPGQTIDI